MISVRIKVDYEQALSQLQRNVISRIVSEVTGMSVNVYEARKFQTEYRPVGSAVHIDRWTHDIKAQLIIHPDLISAGPARAELEANDWTTWG